MESHLDASADVVGELSFKGTLRISGRFSGQIESDGHLIVDAGGEVKASVRVSRVTVEGRIGGNIEASERVELLQGAEVHCDVAVPTLRVEEGASIHGRMVIGTWS